MVLSCLVEPLVAPLVGRGTNGRGLRTRSRSSRLTATALACSALMAVTTCVDAKLFEDESQERAEETQTVRNAHKKPAPIAYRVFLAELFHRLETRDDESSPSEAPEFEWDAVLAHRLKHSRDIVGISGPRPGQGRRWQRLLAAGKETYLHFGSGQHRSGAPTPAIS